LIVEGRRIAFKQLQLISNQKLSSLSQISLETKNL